MKIAKVTLYFIIITNLYETARTNSNLSLQPIKKLNRSLDLNPTNKNDLLIQPLKNPLKKEDSLRKIKKRSFSKVKRIDSNPNPNPNQYSNKKRFLDSLAKQKKSKMINDLIPVGANRKKFAASFNASPKNVIFSKSFDVSDLKENQKLDLIDKKYGEFDLSDLKQNKNIKKPNFGASWDGDIVNRKKDLRDLNKGIFPKPEKHVITKQMIASKNIGFDFCLQRDLKILGISPEVNYSLDPFTKSAKSKSFCSRGKTTCCSTKQIKSTQKYFNKGNKTMMKNFELVEEVLTLFKGNNYKNVIEELLKTKDKCDYVIRTTFDYHKATTVEEFLSKKIFDKFLDTVNDILNELPIYVKGNSEYFGNIMCSLCSQKSHPVHYKDDTFNMDLNVNSCLNMNEFYIYEMRLSLLFRKFIIVLANLIKCKNGEYDNPKFYINTFDSNLLNEMHSTIHTCDESSKKNVPECNKMCEKKHIMYYKFPFDIFKTASQTLKILYKEFVDDGDIEDYYRNVKNENFQDFYTDNPIFFFRINSMNDKLNLEGFKWNVQNSYGMNIFFEKVGDDYFISSNLKKLFCSFVLALSIILC